MKPFCLIAALVGYLIGCAGCSTTILPTPNGPIVVHRVGTDTSLGYLRATDGYGGSIEIHDLQSNPNAASVAAIAGASANLANAAGLAITAATGVPLPKVSIPSGAALPGTVSVPLAARPVESFVPLPPATQPAPMPPPLPPLPPATQPAVPSWMR